MNDDHSPDGLRIMLVDDDLIVAEIVAKTLSDAGYQVTVTENGADAIDIIYDANPDLVLLDCTLPGRPGMMLLRDIRKSELLRTLPIVMLTARTSNWHAEAAFDRGADAYLKKPFEPTELIVVATKLLNGQPIPKIAI